MSTPSDVSEFVRNNALTERAPLQTSIRILTQACIYIGLFLIGKSLSSPLVWSAIWTIQALMFPGMFSLAHEAMHGNLYKFKFANRVVGFTASSLILINYSLYQALHFQHHRLTHLDGDPEPQANIIDIKSYLKCLNGFPFVLELWVTSFKTLFGIYPTYCTTDKQRRNIRVDACFFHILNLLTLISLCIWPMFVLTFWLLPVSLYTLILFFFFGLPEHHECADGGTYFHTTRTILSNPIFRFIYWNGNYHVEHHLYPSVPYFNLPKLHCFVRDRLKYSSPSFIAWHTELIRKLMR